MGLGQRPIFGDRPPILHSLMPIITVRGKPSAEKRVEKILLLEFSNQFAVAATQVNRHESSVPGGGV